jgi:hypothetical protein
MDYFRIMQPPDSYNPNQPPAYGNQQPGQYPAQYPGQYPSQYPPQYQYPQYAPPPKKPMSRTIIIVIVVVVVLVVLVPVVLAGILVFWLQALPSSGGNVETSLGLHAVNQGNGNWLVEVTSGTKYASDVDLQVTDSSTGLTTVNKGVAMLAPTYGDPDGTYNDNNHNEKLDAGDTILLKSSGGHIGAGDKVQLLVGSNIIGSIRALPG